METLDELKNFVDANWDSWMKVVDEQTVVFKKKNQNSPLMSDLKGELQELRNEGEYFKIYKIMENILPILQYNNYYDQYNAKLPWIAESARCASPEDVVSYAYRMMPTACTCTNGFQAVETRASYGYYLTTFKKLPQLLQWPNDYVKDLESTFDYGYMYEGGNLVYPGFSREKVFEALEERAQNLEKMNNKTQPSNE